MPDPKVRFKRDDGSSYPAWRTIPMSEVFTEISEKNHPELPVLSVQQGVGTVLRDSSDRNILYDKSNLKNYKAMKKDDYIIHLRSFEGGLECSNYDGISSPAYRILRSQAILPAAYRDYFRSYEFIHNKLAVSVVGIRDGKNIDMDTFWQIPMSIPCIEEQQKIADFLSSVDAVITASEEEVANLETQKNAVMKKIFSQEVRFKKADGTDFPEWEEKVFTDVAQLINGRAYSADEMLASGKYMILRVGNLFSNNEYYYSDMELDDDKYIDEGDLIYAWSATFGPRIYHGEKCIYHYHIWKVIPYSVEKDYFLHFLYADVDNLQSELNGGTMKHITKEIMEKRIVPLPCKDEQHLIADFLSNFDEAITAAKKELELWKELKKGLLQQMFV